MAFASVIFKCFESRAAQAGNCDSFAISFATFQFTPVRVIVCFVLHILYRGLYSEYFSRNVHSFDILVSWDKPRDTLHEYFLSIRTPEALCSVHPELSRSGCCKMYVYICSLLTCRVACGVGVTLMSFGQ